MEKEPSPSPPPSSTDSVSMKTQPQDKATESLGGHRGGQEAQCPNRAWEAGETRQGGARA